jgi:hypothetical protein
MAIYETETSVNCRSKVTSQAYAVEKKIINDVTRTVPEQNEVR